MTQGQVEGGQWDMREGVGQSQIEGQIYVRTSVRSISIAWTVYLLLVTFLWE